MKSPLGACKGAGETWEISLLSSQFCHKPKTALKNKVLKKKSQGNRFFSRGS